MLSSECYVGIVIELDFWFRYVGVHSFFSTIHLWFTWSARLDFVSSIGIA